MRKLGLLLVLGVLGLAGAALAAPGISLDNGTRFEFTDCSSSGSSAQTVTRGTYLFRVTSEDVFVCYASTCTGTSGEKFPAGTVFLLRLDATSSVSCRSAGSTADVILTKAS